MEERRTLFYLSEEDIPSSATPVAANTTTEQQGNVLYIPIEFRTKPRSGWYNNDYTIVVSSAGNGCIEYNDILYTDITLSYGGNTLYLKNHSCCKIYLSNVSTISGTSYTHYYYLTPLILEEKYSTKDTYYPYMRKVRDGQTVYTGTIETSNNSEFTNNCVLFGYVKIRFALYGAVQSGITSISKYLSFTIKGSGSYYPNFENPVYVDTE